MAFLFSPPPYPPPHSTWANVKRARETAASAAQRQLNERNRWGCQTTFSIWLGIVNFSQISQEFWLNRSQIQWVQILRCIPQGRQLGYQLWNKLTSSSRKSNVATHNSPDMEIMRSVYPKTVPTKQNVRRHLARLHRLQIGSGSGSGYIHWAWFSARNEMLNKFALPF